MNNSRTITLTMVLLVAASACSSQRSGEPESTGTTSEALLTPATSNFAITGTYYGESETSVAFSAGLTNPINGAKGGWVVGWNAGGPGTTFAGWSYGYNGATVPTWTASRIPTGTGWGDPGASPFDGATFSGWRSDPSIAPVTDPALSNGGLKMMYTMVGCTNACSETNDAIIALSGDGGKTWGNTQYVSGNSTQGGGGVDNPWIATNPISPYHSFVVWANGSSSTFATLAQVQYSNPESGSPVLTVSNYTDVPVTGGHAAASHPRIAVGQYTGCNASAHEGVFIVYATAFNRCFPGGTPNIGNQAYYLTLFDVPSATFIGGPWLLYSDASWQNCVGGGTGTNCSAGGQYCEDNDPRAQIAVDWKSTSGAWFVNHTISGPHGTRVNIESGTIGCSAGVTTATFNSTKTPDPCDPSPLNGQCQWDDGGLPDGGSRVQDQWGQAIAFNYSGTTPYVVATWYDTRDDANNIKNDLYMMYSENRGSSWSGAEEITVAGTGQTVPWDYHLGGWADYQSLAPDMAHPGFLGAWGGDCRTGAATCGIFSTTLR